MSTSLGGHSLVADPQLPMAFYDVCEDGTRGSRGAPGDLLQCVCGWRVGILHFVGATRGHPLLAQLNASVLEASGSSLRHLARLRASRPVEWRYVEPSIASSRPTYRSAGHAANEAAEREDTAGAAQAAAVELEGKPRGKSEL